MAEMTRVYVIDDQSIVRAALKRLLEDDCGFEVVGDCGDARAAIEELGTLRPDVVTLDVTMPGLSGIDALPKLAAATPRSKFLILTNHESGRFLEESLRAGASGFLTKDSEPAELKLAVESIRSGRNYVTPRVANALVERVRTPEGEVADGGGVGRLAALTAREREVFQLLALGRSNKEVASELGVSLGTAKKHRENLQRKLDAHSTAELARIAIQEGLLSG
ncbi:MAG: response regulator transcription factor [Planctomycetota bacterium]